MTTDIIMIDRNTNNDDVEHSLTSTQTFVPIQFENIPSNCHIEIFKYLDKKTLCNMGLVSKQFKNVSRDGQVWETQIIHKLAACRVDVTTILEKLSALNVRAFAEKSSSERIEFLRSTVELARDYIEKQNSSKSWRLSRNQYFVFSLFSAFYSQLKEINMMLTELASGRYQITCNFDIFECALRRYCEELRILVPADFLIAQEFDKATPNGTWDSLPDPRITRGITDFNAMNAWCTAFGDKTFLVPFDLFYRKVICTAFPNEITNNSRFADHLKYHANFPLDGMMTTWRFQVLVSTFGPWNQLADNFIRFALNPGFVGLVNMIKAEELLIENFQQLIKNTVLIRYSRRQPEVLAFTSIDIRSRRIEHRRNVDKSGRVIPIAEFLDKIFPGYELARIGLDDAITKVSNTFTFARYSNPYTYSHYPTIHTTSAVTTHSSNQLPPLQQLVGPSQF
jgi:hypothetical protein